jgi:FkbM family methyltransferase
MPKGPNSMNPLDFIDELKRQYINTDIDWEMILEHGYRLFLDGESTVIDIGGHAGRHTDVFVKQIGCSRVVVFEPLPNHFQVLCERYKNYNQVEVFDCALGEQTGTSDFVFNANSPEESGLKERVYNNPENRKVETLRVARATLDSWATKLNRVDFVKIDTEGGEVDIIRGGREVIGRHRPILSIEYGASSYEVYGHNQDTLFDLMTELDYGLFDLFGHALTARQDWRACTNNYYWDFYGVPTEAAASFSQRLSGIRELVPSCLRPVP